MTENVAEPFVFADLPLSRRLEMAEARSNARFVEARARVSPASGAEWVEVAGAYALFDGAASPLTQTFGLGISRPVGAEEMATVEEFFRRRGAEVFHEVSPLADASALSLLNERGYRPVEFTSVMFRPLSAGFDEPAATDGRLRVRLIEGEGFDLWAQTSARGWSEFAELGEFMLDVGRVSAACADSFSFLAEFEGEPIATGAMSISGGVALLAGASTVPEGRRRGAQSALLDARLRFAAERGCDLAMMGAQPGSASQRNAERNGFRTAYTRVKWRLSA
jgi:GNAT superfamily N-acetyltransferase